MHRSRFFTAVAVAGTLLSTHLGASAAVAAEVHSFPAVGQRDGVLKFSVRGLDAKRIRSARVVKRGRRALRVDLARVRRAANRGVLHIRMPKSWRRAGSLESRARARRAHHRSGHKLRVVTDGTAPATTITSGPPTTTTSSPTTTTPTNSGPTTPADPGPTTPADPGPTTPADPGPTTPTDPGPTPAAKATTRPVGSPPLSDAEAAARVKRSSFEPRPGNTKYNQTMPTAAQLAIWNLNPDQSGFLYNTRVTGRFTGTTDEILQWAAHKWGFDEDVFRAVAANESWWHQTAGGAAQQGGGLMSPTWSQHVGSLPIGMDSTAFNVDWFGATMRFYFDGGATWFNDVERGRQYSSGDFWGCIGAWYAGRWHTAGAEKYVGEVKHWLDERIWEKPGF